MLTATSFCPIFALSVPPTSTLVPDLTPLTPVLFFDCSVRGDEPLNVTWAKDGVPLDFSRVSKYVRIPDESSGSHRLLIPSTSESDVGVYSCQASNYLGSQEDATYGESCEYVSGHLGYINGFVC